MNLDKVKELLKSGDFQNVCLAVTVMKPWSLKRVIKLFEECHNANDAVTGENYHLTQKLITVKLGSYFLIVTEKWKILNNGHYLFLTEGKDDEWIRHWALMCKKNYIEI